MAQVVEHLLSKCQVLNSNLSTGKKNLINKNGSVFAYYIYFIYFDAGD
jgi:hypothetical protein